MKPDTTTLSPKRAAFVREYVIDWNATAAALRAGYSARTARSQGQRLLTGVDIQNEVSRHREAVEGAALLSYEESLRILSAMARGNVGDYLDADGHIDMERLKRHCPEAVQSIETRSTTDDDGTTTVVTKFRLCDRVRALERLAKLRGWDQPSKVQTEDVTPARHDLSKLTDAELEQLETLTAKAAPG